MGYYVNLKESTAILPYECLIEAYNCFLALETNYDHMKNGGGGGIKWFSWMNDWTDECKTAAETLDCLGFHLVETDGGYLISEYDQKEGQADIFFRSISHLLSDSYMFWIGEDGERWAWVFEDGKMFIVKPNSTEEFMPDFNNPQTPKAIEHGN